MSFLESQVVYLNTHAQRDLSNRIGEIAVIHECLYESLNFDYKIQFEDSSFVKVRESEINKLTEEQLEILQFVYRGNEVLYAPTNQRVIVSKVDLVHNQVEVDYLEGGTAVVDIDKLKPLEDEDPIEAVTNERNFDDLLNIFFKHYKNQADTYTLPKQLLINLLDQIFEEE